MNDAAWSDLGPLDAFPSDKPTPALLGARRVVVLRGEHGGIPRFDVFAESCPHAGDSLLTGFRDGARYVCRGHGFAFDLDTGACTRGDRDLKLPLFAVRVRDGRVEARDRSETP